MIRPLLVVQPSLEYLKRFQWAGVDWLLKKTGCILADDMGLGKTLQVIATLQILFSEGEIRSALIICPKSILSNWEFEISKWAPQLSYARVTPLKSIREAAWKLLFGNRHILLTNYEQFRKPPEILTSQKLDVIVADEAHRIRNAGAQVVRGIKTLVWNRFWALTGTPIERDPEDLVTILSTVDPLRVSPTDAKLPSVSLRSLARPYILRRLKSDVLDELPPVVESKTVLDLLPAQRRRYDKVLRTPLSDENLLSQINQLRQICDYDSETGQSIKIERIVELVGTINKANEKTVVFSYLLQPLEILEKRLRHQFSAFQLSKMIGAMSLSERTRALLRFRNDPAVSVLLVSSKIGGEGLTLTEANHVIFLNEWWNPSANNQARDRVVRIGQGRIVHVYRFVCHNTIEEALEHIQQSKEDIFQDLIDVLADRGNEVPSEVMKKAVLFLKRNLTG
jgi:SNF2 family DNA or RNA helicase